MRTNIHSLALSFAALSVFAAAHACTKGDASSLQGGTLSEKKDDVLVSCKLREDGKGKAVEHSKLSISVVESDQAGANQVALGFKGRWDDQERISYSEGDQPVFASLSKVGDKVTLTSLKKECAGHCENYMLIIAGGGDNEETRFVAVESLRLDLSKRALKISGTEDTSSAAKSRFDAEFSKCEVNNDVLGRVSKSLSK